jgi:hypothetical protein
MTNKPQSFNQVIGNVAAIDRIKREITKRNEGEIQMAKAKAKTAAPAQAQAAAKTAGDTFDAGLAKVKEFGKNVKAKAAELGCKAKAHVSRNRAAYIAGGAGVAAGALGGAALARRKKAQKEELTKNNFRYNFFLGITKKAYFVVRKRKVQMFS